MWLLYISSNFCPKLSVKIFYCLNCFSVSCLVSSCKRLHAMKDRKSRVLSKQYFFSSFSGNEQFLRLNCYS